MKTKKRYYHDGDGIIREVETVVSKTLKEKKNESKLLQRKEKKQNS